MARDLDVQLLEAVSVRRGRLREALLWGRDRRRLATVNGVRQFLAGLVLAAVVCAGCVGCSFLQQAVADREAGTAGTTQR